MRGVILLILFLQFCYAADFYIRDGTSGTTCTDWNDACDSLPATLQRGSTYWVADGNYGSYAFDDAESGASFITIKKATEQEHGTETGWQRYYGDGSAEWGELYFKRSYYIFDGVTGGGRGNFRSDHGFRFNMSFGGYGITIGDPWGPQASRESDRTNITIKHIEVQGTQLPCAETGGGGIKIAGGKDGHLNIHLSHLWLHDLAIGMQGAFVNHLILEDSIIERQASSSQCHSEGWAAWGPSVDVTVRNNIFTDIEGTAYIAIENAYDWNVYNNIFMCTDGRPYSCGVGNGVIGTTDHDTETTSGWKVHHNNFINIINAAVDLNSPNGPPSSNNYAYNNIFYGNSRVTFSGIADNDYNWYLGNGNSDSLAGSESNGQLGAADPFVNWQAGDFRLKGPTSQGIITPFATDMAGVLREGSIDRGALEYTGSCTPLHTADTDCSDGMITIAELMHFIGRWRQGNVLMGDMMQAIRIWKG